jgi:hypothetical protein
MALNDAGKNKALGALAIDSAKIHTADPTAAGTANEVTGGTYSAQAITWAAASAGNLDSSNQPLFDIPAGTTVSHYSLWSGATCLAFGTLSATEAFTGAGQYKLTDADITIT